MENKDTNKEQNPNNFDKDEFFHSQNPEFQETKGPIGMKNSENDPEEYNHLKTIVSAFFNYQIDSLRDVQRMERDFESIDKKYKERMSFNYIERIEKIKNSLNLNSSKKNTFINCLHHRIFNTRISTFNFLFTFNFKPISQNNIFQLIPT